MNRGIIHNSQSLSFKEQSGFIGKLKMKPLHAYFTVSTNGMLIKWAVLQPSDVDILLDPQEWWNSSIMYRLTTPSEAKCKEIKNRRLNRTIQRQNTVVKSED